PPLGADPRSFGVARAGRVGTPDRARPLREHATRLGQLFRGDLRLLVQELHELEAELHALVGVVGHPQLHQQDGPAHYSEPDGRVPLRQSVDLCERVRVRIDHVVEEVGAEVHRGAQPVPVDPAILDEQPDVDRAQVANVVGEQRLLAAGIGRLVAAQRRYRVVLVGAVDEEYARLARLPGAVHDLPEYVARIELAYGLLGARVD